MSMTASFRSTVNESARMTDGKRKRELIAIARETDKLLEQSKQLTVGFRHICSDCGMTAEPLRLAMREVREKLDDAELELYQLRVELGDAEV